MRSAKNDIPELITPDRMFLRWLVALAVQPIGAPNRSVWRREHGGAVKCAPSCVCRHCDTACAIAFKRSRSARLILLMLQRRSIVTRQS